MSQNTRHSLRQCLAAVAGNMACIQPAAGYLVSMENTCNTMASKPQGSISTKCPGSFYLPSVLSPPAGWMLPRCTRVAVFLGMSLFLVQCPLLFLTERSGLSWPPCPFWLNSSGALMDTSPQPTGSHPLTHQPTSAS